MKGTSARESYSADARLAAVRGNAGGKHRGGSSKNVAARSATGDRGAVIESDDGAVSFALKVTGDRLFVERTHRSNAGTMTVQCLLIDSHEEFRRWCAVEPTRFQHPVVFDRLWRYGNEVLGHRG